jgi:hypothetical protein
MRKTVFVVLIALAVLAAAACQNSVTGPSPNSPAPAKAGSTGPTATIDVADLFGTWQATKAEGSSALKPGVTRNLVAEGGTVTLVLEANNQAVGNAIPDGRYTITVAMPGTKPGVDSGYWFFGAAWQEQYKGLHQIDFYPASLGPDPEYGCIPAFLAALSGNTLTLWDSGLTFLPFDFGWGNTPGMAGGTVLNLEFTRK